MATPTSSAGSFNTGALVGQIAQIGIQKLFAVSDAKKQRELEEKIAKMSLQNQKEIAGLLAKAQTDIEKQRIAFQILALEKNEALVKNLEKDKNTTLMVLGGGAVVLAVVILIAKFKK